MENEEINKFLSFLLHGCESIIQKKTKTESMVFHDFPKKKSINREISIKRWAAWILILSDDLQMEMQFSFSNNFVKKALQHHNLLDDVKDNEKALTDFMKEITNLCAGFAQQTLEEMDKSCVIGTPVLSRGLDSTINDEDEECFISKSTIAAEGQEAIFLTRSQIGNIDSFRAALKSSHYLTDGKIMSNDGIDEL